MENLRRILVLIAAVLIVFVGLLAGAIGAISALFGTGSNQLLGITLGASMLVLALGLGLPLGWAAVQALRGVPSPPFEPRRPWRLAILLMVALAAGQAILLLDLAPALTFWPFYIAAAVLPPLLVLGLVGRALAGRTRRRDVLLEVSSGAFVSTLLATMLEIGAILGLTMAVILAIAIRPGGAETLQRLIEWLQDPAVLQDPAIVARLVDSPLVVAGVLAVLAGIVPLIEEAVKTLGVGLLAYRRPGMSQAFLWGLACGAGFSLAEGLLNSATVLDTWLVVAVSRMGGTLLHCFTGALMGLAWFYVISSRRWGRSVGLYAASVAVHGTWNALAAGLSLIPLRSGATATSAEQFLANSATIAIGALLLLLAAATVAGLAALTRRVRQMDPAPA